MSRGRVFLFRFLAIGLGLLAGAILLEVFHLASNPSLRRRAGFALDLQACTSSHRRAVWYQDFDVRRVGMLSTLEPFCRDLEFDVRHNSQGFRGPEYTTAHPPETLRISVLGDSFTWGQGVSTEETFAAVLENRLDRQCAGSWEVLNHGVQGSRIVDNAIRLVAHVEALEPDLVVVQVLANDLYYTSWEFILPLLTVHDLRDSWLAGLPIINAMQRSRPAFDLADLQKRERLRSFSPGSLEWDLFLASLDRFAAWSHRTSTPIYFVVFPDLTADPGNFERYTRMPPEVAIIERAVGEIERRHLAVLDVVEVFRRDAGVAELAISDGHPNATAHRLVGEALFEALDRQDVVPCPSGVTSGHEVRRGGSAETYDPRWRREQALREEAAESWREIGGSYGDQAAFYERLADLQPRNPWIAEQLAYAHFRAEDHDRSDDLYRSLAERAPDLAAPWTYLAEMSGAGDRRADLERMIRVVPDHADALEQLLALPLGEDDRRACEWLARLLRYSRYPAQTRRALAVNRRLRCGNPRTLLDPASGG